MKLAFIYGPFSTGERHFDFNNLLSDPRGLTGSESSCFLYAKELSKRHAVTIYAFCKNNNAIMSKWGNVSIINLKECKSFHINGDDFDAVLAWNEPDALETVRGKCVKIVNQQLNDFGYCGPDFQKFVDVYLSPSRNHLEYVSQFTKDKSKWRVQPNGVDCSRFIKRDRIPGSVLYSSSPDRGLHLLLQEWPKIKAAVPHANLKIFYNLDSWCDRFLNNGTWAEETLRKSAHRAAYIKYAIKKLKDYDVQYFNSISYDDISKEMSQAMVLAYPCHTVRYTEGFSVTSLEACAAGMVPVISGQDALGSIYGADVASIVPAPVTEHLDQFVKNVIRGLTDQKYFDDTTTRAKGFALNHDFSVLACQLEETILEAVKNKNA